MKDVKIGKAYENELLRKQKIISLFYFFDLNFLTKKY
jgi:hypothetical protein